MSELLKQSAAVLGDKYDVEIIEKHHNQKLDAPSGTALMLADAVASALPYDAEYVYDRHERREKRPAHEIGISAIRGGTIVGEHSVLFCGRDEIIEIKHTALSREVFAVGAVDAAAFMAERTQPGMYDMSDVIPQVKPKDFYPRDRSPFLCRNPSESIESEGFSLILRGAFLLPPHSG